MVPSDEAFDFPEPPDGLLRPSQNSVVAFLDEPDQAEAVVQDLVAQGFDRDGIYVLCSPKGAERLDVSGRQHGLRGRMYRLLEWLGDAVTRVTRRAQPGAREGKREQSLEKRIPCKFRTDDPALTL